jgi:hypothetical protein
MTNPLDVNDRNFETEQLFNWSFDDPTFQKRLFPFGGEHKSNIHQGFKNCMGSDIDINVETKVGS